MPNASAVQLYRWLVDYLPHVNQQWGVHGEIGVDLGTPYGTLITSLTYGSIEGMGYYGGGGVVSVAANIDGKKTTVYYQHLDLISIKLHPGMAILPGTGIGWSGGQLHGGHHPATCCSSGPHIEIGRDAPYGGIWGKQFQTNRDPVPWLQRLVSGDHTAWGVPVGASASTVASQILNNLKNPITDPANPSNDQSIADFCGKLDALEVLQNPFDGTLDWNPLDGVPALGTIGSALWQDSVALTIRGIIILFGFLLAWRVVNSVIPIQQKIDTAANKAIEGVQAGAALA